MKILVTGGAGFIGSHVVDCYLEFGHDVVVLDDLSSGNLAYLPKKAKFYQLDISSDHLAEIFQKERPEVVNHLVAQIDVRQSIADPLADAKTNILGSLNLMKHCARHKVQKIIFSSSGGAVYGEQYQFPAREDHRTEPQSPYGITKLTIEKYLQFYFQTYQIPFVALRYANVYGPRQNSTGEAGVVAIFCHKLLRKEIPTIFGDGSQTRDYVFVEDVVHCNIEALRPDVQGIYNVGTGIETTVNTIATEIIRLTGQDITPRYGHPKAGEQKRSCLKPGALQKIPPTPLSHGLRKTVEWHQQLLLRNAKT